MDMVELLSPETLEQVVESAQQLAYGTDGVQDGDTYYGLGWTVVVNRPSNHLTVSYETEDGELLTWSVDPKATGQLNNQRDLASLADDILYYATRFYDFAGWTLLH